MTPRFSLLWIVQLCEAVSRLLLPKKKKRKKGISRDSFFPSSVTEYLLQHDYHSQLQSYEQFLPFSLPHFHT
jgi:hypothetical protein